MKTRNGQKESTKPLRNSFQDSASPIFRKQEIRVTFRFWPNASLSFSYSFSPMKAYSNLHEVILTSILAYFFNCFSLRFFLFSSLSFLVNGLALALLIPKLITTIRNSQTEELSLTTNKRSARAWTIELWCNQGRFRRILPWLSSDDTSFLPSCKMLQNHFCRFSLFLSFTRRWIPASNLVLKSSGLVTIVVNPDVERRSCDSQFSVYLCLQFVKACPNIH